jgi:hypothetical protein
MSNSQTIKNRLCTFLNADGKPKPQSKLWSQVDQGIMVGFWYGIEANEEQFEFQEEATHRDKSEIVDILESPIVLR